MKKTRIGLCKAAHDLWKNDFCSKLSITVQTVRSVININDISQSMNKTCLRLYKAAHDMAYCIPVINHISAARHIVSLEPFYSSFQVTPLPPLRWRRRPMFRVASSSFKGDLYVLMVVNDKPKLLRNKGREQLYQIW